jgi:Ser/Thr protein kinase RdoA (MazF antagonist)
LDKLLIVAEQFTLSGKILNIHEHGRGNVNDTFMVMVRSAHSTSPSSPGSDTKAISSPGEWRFILQRLNTRVFKKPELVMANLVAVAEHVRQRLGREQLPPGRRWEMPRVLLTKDGADRFIDGKGSFWRALSFIEGETFDVVRDLAHAREVGFALGLFHKLVSDLPPESLADTLPGFHITPLYLKHYDAVRAGDGWRQSPEAAYCLRFVEERRALASVLEDAKAQGKLFLRPIHGDPKVNNVMLDAATGRAVGMIDLDTVKPGLAHYDIGDCLRSGANPVGEETEAWQQARFDVDTARALLTGYISQARGFLTDNDYAFLYEAIRVLTFELGLRFFTDYLEGNVYFKARHRDHNLSRALVQFRLTESLEAQETAMRGIIQELK